MVLIEIEGKRVEVDDSFLQLPPDQQEATVEEIASSLSIKPKAGALERGMGQLNAGIADTVGGLVDFVNPLDDLGVTGSAKEGLRSGMERIGAHVAEDEPQGVYEGMMHGAGNAAGAAIPVAKVAQGARAAGGMVGNIADDAYTALASRGGIATELAAGGASGAGREAAEQRGWPEWAQTTSEVAAGGIALPAALAGSTAAVRGGAQVAGNLPLVGAGRRVARDVKRSIIPMTDTGAREVARDRLHTLAGGEDRARELSQRIEPDSEFGLTPAQQTEDPNLLGLERAAAAERPQLRERLQDREAASRQAAKDNVAEMGGDVRDAQGFFQERHTAFKTNMQDRVDRVISGADDAVARVGPGQSESANSTQMVQRVKVELDNALQEEASLWAQVPRDAEVPTQNIAQAISRMEADLSYAQRRDMPSDLRALFDGDSPFGEATSVREMHGLYSEMRRMARSAMAGTDQNRNRARIANEIAEAALKDLGARAAGDEVGRTINEARAFSRALHETFDGGATGRILQRSIDGDQAIDPEAAMRRTVGRSGAQGMADASNITTAAPRAGENIQDYLRGRFTESMMSPTREFTARSARTWMRNNKEVLGRFPELRADLSRALQSRETAAAFALRADARMKLADQAPAARFAEGRDDKAALSILGAKNPEQTAGSVMATARKDPTGAAVAGVKGSLTDHLIGAATRDGVLSGRQLQAALEDRRTAEALRVVFSGDELGRMHRVARELAKLDAPTRDVGQVIDSPANRIIEMVVRVAAAQRGGQLGGGSMGGSIQTANIFTERARTALRNLTNTKAREILIDAIEDPRLFHALMSEPKAFDLKPEIRNRLAPYLAGTGAVAADREQEPLRVEVQGASR